MTLYSVFRQTNILLFELKNVDRLSSKTLNLFLHFPKKVIKISIGYVHVIKLANL
jgi:hypothetical protein